MSTRDVIETAAECSARYLENIQERSVASTEADIAAAVEALGGPMPDDPSDPVAVIELLDRYGSAATTATAGPRFFGFVIGGSLPAAVGANQLLAAWDQNAGLEAASPVGSMLERITGAWLLDVLKLPDDCAVGFVTGATIANFTALAAARHAVLKRAGWDVENDGLFGAPQIDVVVGEEVHVSVLKSLNLLGLGRRRVLTVPTDNNGRMRADKLPPLSATTLVCIQSGNVNTGAFDPAVEICAAAKESGAWVHVDGAFGLWVRATPELEHLAAGLGDADSWATDAHKWLNVSYDSGLAFIRDPESLRAAMSATAAYLTEGRNRDPSQFVPELSRRARGVEIWAAMKSLGRSGLAELIERTCRHARRFAEGLADTGYEILNTVELNQVLVSFGDDETTKRVIDGIQKDGTCWCSGTHWKGREAMRVSISSWATTDDDVEASLGAMIRVAGEIR
ncbi:MAG: aminotransferase class V-fold PLP-dependent enzyme [Gammaproteobacteria bacterium]